MARVESVIAGAFLLAQRLRPRLEAAASGRVALVASGGMHTAPLDVALCAEATARW